MRKTRYTVIGFIGDIIMLCILNVFWLVWIFVRESRNRV